MATPFSEYDPNRKFYDKAIQENLLKGKIRNQPSARDIQRDVMAERFGDRNFLTSPYFQQWRQENEQTVARQIAQERKAFRQTLQDMTQDQESSRQLDRWLAGRQPEEALDQLTLEVIQRRLGKLFRSANPEMFERATRKGAFVNPASGPLPKGYGPRGEQNRAMLSGKSQSPLSSSDTFDAVLQESLTQAPTGRALRDVVGPETRKAMDLTVAKWMEERPEDYNNDIDQAYQRYYETSLQGASERPEFRSLIGAPECQSPFMQTVMAPSRAAMGAAGELYRQGTEEQAAAIREGRSEEARMPDFGAAVEKGVEFLQNPGRGNLRIEEAFRERIPAIMEATAQRFGQEVATQTGRQDLGSTDSALREAAWKQWQQEEPQAYQEAVQRLQTQQEENTQEFRTGIAATHPEGVGLLTEIIADPLNVITPYRIGQVLRRTPGVSRALRGATQATVGRAPIGRALMSEVHPAREFAGPYEAIRQAKGPEAAEAFLAQQRFAESASSGAKRIYRDLRNDVAALQEKLNASEMRALGKMVEQKELLPSDLTALESLAVREPKLADTALERFERIAAKDRELKQFHPEVFRTVNPETGEYSEITLVDRYMPHLVREPGKEGKEIAKLQQRWEQRRALGSDEPLRRVEVQSAKARQGDVPYSEDLGAQWQASLSQQQRTVPRGVYLRESGEAMRKGGLLASAPTTEEAFRKAKVLEAETGLKFRDMAELDPAIRNDLQRVLGIPQDERHVLVPKEMFDYVKEVYTRDPQTATTALQELTAGVIRPITAISRDLLLTMPKTAVNNMIGAANMFAMAADPSMLRAAPTAMAADVKGIRKFFKDKKWLGKTLNSGEQLSPEEIRSLAEKSGILRHGWEKNADRVSKEFITGRAAKRFQELPGVRGMRAINEASDDMIKLAAFTAALDDTSPDSIRRAAKVASDVGLAFTSPTPLDRAMTKSGLQDALLFYRFQKEYGRWAAQWLSKRPGRFAAVEKIRQEEGRRSAEEAMAEGRQIPSPEDLPSWMRGRAQVAAEQEGTPEETVRLQVSESPVGPVESFGLGLNPVAQAAYEAIAGGGNLTEAINDAQRAYGQGVLRRGKKVYAVGKELLEQAKYYAENGNLDGALLSLQAGMWLSQTLLPSDLKGSSEYLYYPGRELGYKRWGARKRLKQDISREIKDYKGP